jgi:hypothetical protein
MLVAACAAAIGSVGNPPTAAAQDAKSVCKRIDNALSDRRMFPFENFSIRQLANYLTAEYKIPVAVDEKALSDLSLTSDSRLGRVGPNTRYLSQALLEALAAVNLGYIDEPDRLLITARGMADYNLELKLYDVADLMADIRIGAGQYDDQALIGAITSEVAPSRWSDSSYSGAMKVLHLGRRHLLAVAQNPYIQRLVEAQLRRLRMRTTSRAATADLKVRPPQERAAEAAIAHAEAFIRDTLDRRADFDLKQMPIQGFADYLKREFNLPVELEEDVLADHEIWPDVPTAPVRAPNLRLAGALNRALEPYGRGWIIHHGKLLITYYRRAIELVRIREFDVTDLVAGDSADRPSGSEALNTLVAGMVDWYSFTHFGEVENPQLIVADGRRYLVVVQHPHLFGKVAAFLDALRKMQHRAGDPVKPTQVLTGVFDSGDYSIGDYDQTIFEERINAILDRRSDVSFGEMPLADLASEFETRFNIFLELCHRKSLFDANVGDPETRTIGPANAVTLRSALDHLLQPAELSWGFVGNALYIAPTCYLRHLDKTLKVYDITNMSRREASPLASGMQSIAKLVQAQVAPEAWNNAGGDGVATEFHGRGIHVLIVAQCRTVHEQIADCLRLLREANRKVCASAATSPGTRQTRVVCRGPRLRQMPILRRGAFFNRCRVRVR